MNNYVKVIFTVIVFATISGNSVSAESNQGTMLKPIEIASPLVSEGKPLVPLKSTKEVLNEVDNKLKLETIKAETVEEKAIKAEEEAKKLADEKQAVASQIEQLKNQIAQAEAEIAEKKRIKELEATQALQASASAPVYASTYQSSTPNIAPRAYVAGNGYAPGYCTYYVKNRRPDIGNYWGNANQWIYSAQSAGYATGSVPAVGAIAVPHGENHVAYVESVSGNMVTISEMNYGYLWNMNTRTVPASSFYYIY